jgi:hypothetical protein
MSNDRWMAPKNPAKKTPKKQMDGPKKSSGLKVEGWAGRLRN